MKKYILTAALAAGLTTAGYSQGTIAFNNFFANGRVYIGATPTDTSTPASGVFTVELFYGAPGTTLANLTADTAAIFTTAASATGGQFYDTATITLPGITAGTGSGDTAQNVELAIVGWTGNYTSLAAAQAAGAKFGETAEFLNPTGGGGSPAAAAANMVNWLAGNPLVLSQVPEPTTIALGGLGAAALLAFRRRK